MAVIFGYELLTMGVFFVLWFLSFPLTFGPFLRRVHPHRSQETCLQHVEHQGFYRQRRAKER